MRKLLESTRVLALGALLGGAAHGQGVLDVLDGETLYEGGSLVTLGFEISRGATLLSGSDRVPDPVSTRETTTRTTLGWQYGLRHDLQVGAALPFVTTGRASNFESVDDAGLGDVQLLAKWRVFRWDAPSSALNIALLAELSLPTGEDARSVFEIRSEPELQLGSGSLDPALGIAATHEPGRWRFNAAALYRWRTDSDGDGFAPGDEFLAEIAVGNRFWLEPYPGPFMRADLALRWYHQDRSQVEPIALPADMPLRDSGSDRTTVGINLAFRPRPAVDLQVSVEVPFWQRVRGTQVGEDWSADITLGFRF